MSTPVGVRSGSRTTVPDAGSADSAVMPAICSAAELATPTWPPRWTKIGWSTLAASSSRAVGSRGDPAVLDRYRLVDLAVGHHRVGAPNPEHHVGRAGVTAFFFRTNGGAS